MVSWRISLRDLSTMMVLSVPLNIDRFDRGAIRQRSTALLRCLGSGRLRLMQDHTRPLRTISEPAAASARAMPSPIPLVEPVTSDTLPSRALRVLLFSGLMAMFMAQSLLVGMRIFRLPLCANLPDRTGATPMLIG